MRAGIIVNVTRADRHRLEAIVLDRSASQMHVWRANIILATTEGCGTAEIMRRSGKSKPAVWRSGAVRGGGCFCATKRASPASHLAAVHEDNLVRDVARKAEFVRDDDRGAAADRPQSGPLPLTPTVLWSSPRPIRQREPGMCTLLLRQ
jgi:hypothetical protein